MDKRFTVTAAIGLTLGMVALMMSCVMLHLHNSYVAAAEQLEYAQTEGWAWCQIERDGLDYNVYCMETSHE